MPTEYSQCYSEPYYVVSGFNKHFHQRSVVLNNADIVSCPESAVKALWGGI